MRAVIDTCVIVDALQSREPFCEDAQSIFLLCANRIVTYLIIVRTSVVRNDTSVV